MTTYLRGNRELKQRLKWNILNLKTHVQVSYWIWQLFFISPWKALIQPIQETILRQRQTKIYWLWTYFSISSSSVLSSSPPQDCARLRQLVWEEILLVAQDWFFVLLRLGVGWCWAVPPALDTSLPDSSRCGHRRVLIHRHHNGCRLVLALCHSELCFWSPPTITVIKRLSTAIKLSLVNFIWDFCKS